MAYTEFMIEGDVNVMVRITDLGDGNFQFDVSVVTEGDAYTGQIGELNGFWFNLPDEGADFSYDSLSVAGVLDYQLAQDDVNKLDGGVNLSGEVLKENSGEFDAGMLIDETGLAGTEGTLSTSFVLSDASGTLTLADFTSQSAEQYFGVRLTSVGEPDGSRDGSLKLGGYPSDTIVEDPQDPVNLAADDFLFVYSTETFGDIETLEDGSESILENDTTDGAAYLGNVTAPGEGVVVEGSNGGLLVVYPDGSIDFDANGEFDFPTMDPTLTEFTYQIEGGSTATIYVEVAYEEGGVVF